MRDDLTLLIAPWVVPIDRSPMRDGGVLFGGGIIQAVGDGRALRDSNPEAQIEDLTGCVLLPGLVNAHVHLELSNRMQGGPPSSFVDWLMDLMGQSADVSEAVRVGVEQCLRFGVSTVGDISRECRSTRPLLSRGPLRVVSYGEVQAMARRRGLLEERLAAAVETTHESERLRIGVTPHAPYSIEPEGYGRCLDFAVRGSHPIATHLAETPGEAPFLADHSGPFRRLWSRIGLWDEHVPKFEGGPIRYAKSLGLLGHPTLLAHVNYCDDDELATLAAGRASVVYCPRTHAFFGHPPHRWQEMLSRGINVAVGTDSCASSPDLNLLDDLRLMHQIAPEVPAHTLFAMATLRAAKAIAMDHVVGSLTIGKAADAVAFSIKGDHPLEELLERSAVPAAFWIGGDRQGA